MADPDLGEMLNNKKPIVLLNNAYWEPVLKEWVPEIKLDELDEDQISVIEQRLFVVVLTPSNISRCSVCGRTISKGTYRIGVPEYDRRGMYGIINRWNHISPCSQKYLKRAIQGYESSLETIEKRMSEVISGWNCLPIGVRDEFLDLCTREMITDSSEFSIESSEELVSRSVVEVRPTPVNLTYELLEFQKEGLAWLCNQEKSKARGGILADEMGMGKTIQTISLLLEHDTPPITDELEKGEVVGKNLVVAPVAAVLQWKQEIERFTKPGSLRVHVYHGSKRNKSRVGGKGAKDEYGGVDIDQADVVITTYPTLEAEYRKIASEFKSKCPYCDRSFLKRTLKIHLRYFCGPNSMRTAKQALTERKSEGLRKAMRTLKIGLEEGMDKAKQLEDIARSLPTISNVYREILAKADLLDDEALASALPWFSSRRSQSRTAVKSEEPRRSDEGGPHKTEIKEEEEEEEKEDPSAALLEWGGLKLPLRSETVKSIRDFLSSIENSRDYLVSSLSVEEKVLDGLIELYEGSKSLRKAELVERLSLLLGLDSRGSSEVAIGSGQSAKTESRENRDSKKRGLAKASGPRKGKGKRRRQSKDSEEEYTAGEGSESEDEVENEQSDGSFWSEEEYSPRSGGRDARRTGRRQSGGEEAQVVEELEDTDEEEEIVQRLRDCSGIFGRSWNRIILDEAHRIKARTTSTAKAIFAIKSRGTKWCLTGTPLQNRVGELYSLVRFVGFHPYAYNFCQKGDCDCKQLNYVSHLKYCSFCGHARSCHYSYFNKLIINPIKRYGFMGEGSEAIRRLKEEVLDQVLLRRTKVQRQEDVKLPPLEIKVIHGELSAPEKDFYTSLYQRSKVQFDTYVNQGTILHNYAHVFDLISRLRQAVDHPYLIVYGKFNNKRDLEYRSGPREEGEEVEQQASDDEPGDGSVRVMPSKSRADSDQDLCYICMDNVSVDKRVTSKCKHGFHIDCIKEYVEQAPQEDETITDFDQSDQPLRGVLGCPVCYVPLTIDFSSVSSSSGKRAKSKGDLDEENDTNDTLESEHMQEQIERELERIEMAKQLGIEVSLDGARHESKEKEDILSCVRNKFITRQIKTQGFESSTKIDTLLEEVNKMMQEDPEAKGIVFSQFTNMLDLVSYRLKKANIGCVMLAGSMSILQRNSILYSFNKFPDLKIILISLKAGGEGLNLQVANYVFLLDPWWNPAVELQAFQRAHRIGQKKKVTALRFITKDTIEERMFQLQEKKQLVFDGTVGASNNALNKLNSDDLKFLFQN
ncbi:Swi2/Snf2 ATPase and Rad16-like protein [Cryptosporidium canis]|uniref:Swi2/Snf2 ATPase and Rad16-like protein n=1 Tax=Cryptosporidium canis TaxID=195482 RepID=A0A9D5HW64_9CRYT|nr:Swi2/Snf2 ATPase and Rad16-like protein [Cryptosporidium canis]